MRGAVKLQAGTSVALPDVVAGRADVSRLLREIERVDYALETESIRGKEQPKAHVVPSMSRALAETITLNHITITDLHSRRQLIEGLRAIKQKAPVIHVTFAKEADPTVTTAMVSWIRRNLHKSALVIVGLQPRILGGCIVRTPVHVYDFSLRNRFARELPSLEKEIKAAVA